MENRIGDKERIQHILTNIERLEFVLSDIFKETYLEDFTIHILCERILQIIGKAAGRISSHLKEKYSDTPWHKIKVTRNIITHEYFEVEYNILWEIIQDEIPELKSEILKIKKSENF